LPFLLTQTLRCRQQVYFWPGDALICAFRLLAGSGILDPHVELAATRLADTSLLHASHLPVTFGLLAFVFAGHAVFPGIYTSMKEKERFPEMLDTTYLIVGATCIVIGVSGYFLYGDKVCMHNMCVCVCVCVCVHICMYVC
jgi:amino acid permease